MTASTHRWAAWLRTPAGVLVLGLLILFLNGLLTAAFAHGVAEGDKGYIEETSGWHCQAKPIGGKFHAFFRDSRRDKEALLPSPLP